MYIYIVIFIMLFILSFIEINRENETNKKYHLLIFFLALFATLGFTRWEVGSDWNQYLEFFSMIVVNPTISNAYRMEPTYYAFTYIVRSITSNYSIFLFLQSAVLLFLHIKLYGTVIKKFDKKNYYVFISLLAFWAIYLGNFTFVRSTIAYTLVFFTIQFAAEKKFLKFVVYILFATLIHRSSIIFLIVYFLINKKFSIINIIISISFILVFLTILKYNILILNSTTNNVYISKLYTYLELAKYNAGSNYSVIFIMLKGLINITFLFILFTLFHKYNYNNLLYDYYYKIYTIGVILFLSMIPFSTVLTNLSYPFLFSQVFLLPEIFASIKNKYLRNVLLFVVSIYLLLRLITRLYTYGGEWYIPMKFIFSDI